MMEPRPKESTTMLSSSYKEPINTHWIECESMILSCIDLNTLH